MNYRDQLLLEINKIHQKLIKSGRTISAESVNYSVTSAGSNLTKLMAAHDYACWHLQELEKENLIDSKIIE